MIPPIGANVTVVYESTKVEVHLGRVIRHHNMNDGYFTVEAVDGRIFVHCDSADEGVTWCRDWSGSKVKALKVVAAL